ncbi:MAG: hypothetical protein GTN36_04325 [Candidatus Aenigmarchaeota archaeon]|nr:hypothetical protein [Candidatus Aenigmarchaeota archaeon]
MDKKILALLVFIVAIGLIVQLAIAAKGGIPGRAPKAPKECRDEIDNDGDGNIDWPNDTGCDSKNDNDETDCGDGVCEGGETSETCPEDCGEPDSCSDTDFGFAPTVKGTVSGYSEGNPYSHTDYCLTSMTLREYYCSGIEPLYSDYNCYTNTTTNCYDGACV